MRLFGGEQVSGLMQRLKVDDTLPLEARMVSGIIENSQSRVEGANFDVRKHLLEYDDVLNKQREQIYSQRDRIFTNKTSPEDVAEMLSPKLRSAWDSGWMTRKAPGSSSPGWKACNRHSSHRASWCPLSGSNLSSTNLTLRAPIQT